MAVLLLPFVAACDGGDRKNAPPDAPKNAPAATASNPGPVASRDCSGAQGDSAHLVCLALNEVERIDSSRAVVTRYLVVGDTTCVETGPDNPSTIDGGGAVQLVGGRVVWAEVSDSTGCAGGRPRRPPLPRIVPP
ncbi:MAG TPA: hypothetical protein VJT67_01250 [Longimicrobiaceae bacterium]|nr:hypothetical protein [Longimicrobiaceae bacterium]